MDNNPSTDRPVDLIALQTRVEQLEAVARSIQERNQRVEHEKAWEVSKTRKAAIVILTYLLMCLVFAVIGIDRFWLNAVIPTAGYYLSTLSLPLVKRWWFQNYK